MPHVELQELRRSFGDFEALKGINVNLEQGEFNEAGQPRLAQGNGADSGQLALFAARERSLREELARINVDQLTPLDALTRLHALVELARKDSESGSR